MTRTPASSRTVATNPRPATGPCSCISEDEPEVAEAREPHRQHLAKVVGPPHLAIQPLLEVLPTGRADGQVEESVRLSSTFNRRTSLESSDTVIEGLEQTTLECNCNMCVAVASHNANKGRDRAVQRIKENTDLIGRPGDGTPGTIAM